MSKQKDLLADTYSEIFEEFWASVWKKKGKHDAWKAWQTQRIEGDAELARIVINDVQKRDRLNAWHPNPSLRPQPSTYLNGRRWLGDWEDELAEQRKFGSGDAAPAVGRAPPPELTGADLRRQEQIDAMDQYDRLANRFLLRYIQFRVRRGRALTDADLAVGGPLLRYKGRAAAHMRDIIGQDFNDESDLEGVREHFAQVMRDNFDRITGQVAAS